MQKTYWRITEEVGEETYLGIRWKTVMTKTVPIKKEQAEALKNLTKMEKEVVSISPTTSASSEIR